MRSGQRTRVDTRGDGTSAMERSSRFVASDSRPVVGETSTANNSGAANDLSVVAPTTPQLFYTSINYTPAGLGLPSSSFIQAGRGDAFVKGILPVRDSDPNLYRQGLFPTLPYS